MAMFVIALLTAAVAALVPKIKLGRRGVPADQSGVSASGPVEARAAPSAAE
jgi:hypothetical protein